VRSPDAEEGTLDLDIDGQSRVDETGRRALAVRRLSGTLAEALEARELTELYERVEGALGGVLGRMEDAGVKLDRQFLEGLRAELAQSCEDLVGRIQAHAGMQFRVHVTPEV